MGQMPAREGVHKRWRALRLIIWV